MSWEKSSEYERTCSCGKGKVIISTEMDDWNRIRSYETVLCDQCREKSYQKIKIKQERDLKFRNLSSQVISYFNNHYSKIWISYFNNKNKKAIWKSVFNLGVENCSLSSFYSKYKTLNTEEYINKLVKVENLPKIINGLNIKDEELESLLVEPLEIFYEIKNEWINEAYMNRK